MLRLAIVRVPEHPDAPDQEPQILFEEDLRAALKEGIAAKRLSGRALRMFDEVFTAVEDGLKQQTTIL